MDTPPKLIPELNVQDFKKSLEFYIGLAEFKILYDRPEEKFAMLGKDGAQIMIEQLSDGVRRWTTAELEPPFGRGINFQIEILDVQSLCNHFKANNYPIFMELEEKWYRMDNGEVGNQQFLVQDPDGYLLRFFQNLGERSRRVDMVTGVK